MQIAKMFASLGFRVDTSGLVNFKKSLSDARGELTNISRGARTATSQFRNLRRETDKLSSSMNKIKNAGGNRSVGGSYRQLAGDVWKVRNALDSIATNQPRTTKAIGKINASVIAGLSHWNAYRRSIVQTRQSLANLNADLSRLRANARIDVRINQNNRGGAGGGAGAGGLGGAGGMGAAGLGLANLLRASLPSMLLGGGLASAGFAGAKAVEASREQTRMESMIKMTSKSGEQFADTIDYVRSEAMRLGLSSVELGKSFAQISMSAKGLSQQDKKEMFTGFSEFMMSMGTSADDQKGIFRAFNQMFSNNRLLQEEINQLSDRGIPATLVYDAAMKAYNTDSMAKIKKLQEDGKLDPNRVLPVMGKMVQDLARDSGAYAKMMESSIVKQGQFYEQLRQTSTTIMQSGLDVYLGKVFGELSKLVKKVEEFAVVLKEALIILNTFRQYLNNLTGGNKLLQLALFVTIFRFRGFVKGVATASRILTSNGKILTAVAALLRGTFGRAIGKSILRFGIWGAAIWAVTKAMSFLYKEIEKGKVGDWTFFDDMSLRVEKFALQIEILGLRLLWFKTMISSGALMNSSLEEVGQLTKNGVSSILQPEHAVTGMVTTALSAIAKIKEMRGDTDMEGKGAGTPFLKNESYRDAKTPKKITVIANFNGKPFETVESEPFFMPR